MPYYASPKTLAERIAYLEQEARRILAAPDTHTPEEIQWAHLMLDSARWTRPTPGKPKY